MTTLDRDSGSVSSSHTPGLMISVVLFRLRAGQLEVRLSNGSALPCTTPTEDETLDVAVQRLLREQVRVTADYMEQLYTFSPVSSGQRDVVVSYLALQQPKDSAPRDDWHHAMSADLVSGADADVLDYALVRLRAKLGYTNIAFHLLPEVFTLTELQHAYEHILQEAVDKRNFRRRILASGILEQTEQKRREGSHRPAALYRFASGEDQTSYLTPTNRAHQEFSS